MLNKKVVVGALTGIGLLGSSSALAAWCPTGPSAPVVTPMFATSKGSIESSYQATGTAIMQSIQNQNALITSALNTYNQQKVISATEFSKAMASNTEVQMTIRQEAEKQKKLVEVAQEYGPRGLGHNICGVLEQQMKTAEIAKNTQEAIATMAKNEVTASAGKYASRNKALATRLAIHNELYCTADQAESGLCPAESRRAGKNLEAATLFEQAKTGSDTYNDKSALIDNIIGYPDDPVPEKHINTTTGIAYQDLKRRKDASRSLSAYGLKWIQARYSVVEHEHSNQEGGQSEDARLKAAQGAESKSETITNTQESNEAYMVRLKKDVDRYFGGGQEHKEWVKFLVGATEKGVMQETLKVEAVNLALLGDRIKAARIKEAMLAALVAAEMYNSGAESEIEKMRLQAQSYAAAAGSNNSN